MDVSTRIEAENVNANVKKVELPTLSDAESTDDELEGLSLFNIAQARKDLYELPGCHQMMLKLHTQKLLGVEVGINVSQEFPWKRVKFKLLAENLFDEIDNGETLQDFFIKYKLDDRVLLGYAPSLIPQEENVAGIDPFVIYVTESDAQAAAAIIRNIETYERFMMNKNLTKRPRTWLSKGSEYEVNLGIPQQSTDVLDVEIQSVYPMQQSMVQFTMRTTSDARDGYVELLAGEAKFQNLVKQRVHVGIQSAPATVHLEQQTDPTFPTNSWAQYFYEIKEDDEDGLDASTEEEEDPTKPGGASKPPTPVTEPEEPKPIPEMSEQVKSLLSILEFNQIDMYRNDYPLISTDPIKVYTNPYLKEIFCFANISRSNGRYVSAVDWYPNLTGIVVAAYSFTAKVSYTTVQIKEKVDEVQRTILQPNPILMWSFMDSLNFKLEFESPREITALSFCPYDGNVLIGGTINGQIIIWDLQDRAKNLESEEHLTISQAANRELMVDFLKWTIQTDERTLVVPAALSDLEHSQTAPITEIKWLCRKFYISPNGRIHETFLKAKSRYFSTLSTDGTLAYWNLDYEIGKAAKAAAKKFLPAALTQDESEFKKLNHQIKPVFMIGYSEPLTSMICDTANYIYTLQKGEKKPSGLEVKTYPMIVEEIEEGMFRNSCIVGSFFGRIENIGFEGQDSGLVVNKENITTPIHSFARVHDGPILALEKNPFYPQIFVSVGRTVMAVWKEDFPFTPILWRVRPKNLTAAKWSTDRPAVLFLTRSDGSFEAWDLLARDDDACLIEVLGGGIITLLSEHRAEIPKKVISIGDYNSSFRMVALPEGFYKPIPNELEQLKAYVEKEVHRKTSIQNWQQNWRVQNADIIEEKKKAEVATAKELERLRAEAEEAKKPKETPVSKQAQEAPPSAAYNLIEKLDKKFDELNYKRLMYNLMNRKKVDPERLERETALEKKRLNFEARKKASIRAAFSRTAEDIAIIRSRLLPVEKEDVQLSDMIATLVKNILKESPTYADVEEEAQSFLDNAEPIPLVGYDEILVRCRLRRDILNKVLGVPLDRAHHCRQQILIDGFKDWDHGDGEFMQALEAYLLQGDDNRSNPSFKTTYSDLDLIPERDT